MQKQKIIQKKPFHVILKCNLIRGDNVMVSFQTPDATDITETSRDNSTCIQLLFQESHPL